MDLKNDLLNYIEGCNDLATLVDAFENFCKLHNTEGDKDVIILFETGTFGCIGQKMFQFSLLRQWAKEDEEYYQLHLNILYSPNDQNATLSTTVWDEDIETNLFDYIRKSEVYLALLNSEIAKVEVYQDET